MERRFDERRRRYLERYGRASEWRIEAPPAARLDVAVVIPAYDEQDELGETLARLFDAATRYDGRAYILCVANQSEDAAVEVRARNASMLHTARAQLNPQRFGLIDAVGEGRELPRALAGVGLARRIGCDALLPYCGPESVLAHLDADTHVGPDYFVELHAALLAPEPRAATLEFRHRAADERTTEALREYERFLQLTARRLAALGSPYGYVALGSAMASNVAAYLEVRGIPVRNAGEDFHFLQKLAKTCGVTPLARPRVEPGGRLSTRVRFGTGQRLRSALDGHEIASLFYRDEAFTLFAEFRRRARGAFETPLEPLEEEMRALDAALPAFLRGQGLDRRWEALRRSAHDAAHFGRQLDAWYDALKTLQFLRFFSTLTEARGSDRELSPRSS